MAFGDEKLDLAELFLFDVFILFIIFADSFGKNQRYTMHAVRFAGHLLFSALPRSG